MNAILGLGTATYISGYGLDSSRRDARVETLVQQAVAEGVAYLDTAALYGDAESIVGRWAADLRARRVRVCTKITLADHGDAPGRAVADVRAALDRLGLQTLDTVLLHSATEAQLSCAAAADALQTVKALGLASRTGASTYGLDRARLAAAQLWCDTVQVEHSILNQSVVTGLRSVRRADQEIVARSVLCKGLLTDRRAAGGMLLDAVGPVLDELDRLAEDWGFSLPELAIRFAMDTPDVDIVVVGVSTRAELATALGAARRTPLTGDQLGALSSFDRSGQDAVHPERWPASVE